MATNNQIISSVAANLVANAAGGITGANIANVTSNLQTFISNNGTAVKSVSIQSSTDASFTANYTLTLPVNDGSTGQVLTTDGSGVLSWSTTNTVQSTIANGNSNVSIPSANGNVNISAVGNTVVVVTGTGANITGNANVSGNANVGNLGTAALIATGNVDLTTSANVALGAVGNVHITGGTANQYLQTDGAGNLSWQTVSTSSISNGNSNVNIPDANGNVNISAVGNANILVVTGTGANITGTLNVTANANLGNVETSNIIATVLNTGLMQNGNSNVTIVANANVAISANGASNVVVVSATSANITGNANISGNMDVGGAANITGTVTGGNIVTTGQITSNRAGNLSNGAGQLFLNGAGNNRIDFNQNGVAAPTFNTRSAGTKIVLYPQLNVSNVDYAIGVDGATLWTTLPQSNTNASFKWYGGITEIANLSGIGDFTAGNIKTASNGGIIAVSNNGTSTQQVIIKASTAAGFNANYTLTLPINDGNSGQYLQTDGSGVLTWANVTSVPSLINGNSNVVVNANANVTISSNGVANVVVVTSTGANVTGNFNASGDIVGARFGTTGTANVGTLNATGNVNSQGQLRSTKAGNLSDGAGQLFLNGAGNNRIDFNTNGLGVPSLTTRSSGAKIVLYPSFNGIGATDYAIGVDGNTVWTSIPESNSVSFFKWYAGETEVANLSGTGVLIASSLKTSVGGNFIAVANNGSSNKQVTIQASTDAGFTGNYTLTLPINDGDSGQVLTTDGSGVLSWAAISSPTVLANGNSNVNIPSANGNVNISAVGNANILVVTGTGANITGTLNVTANANVGNLGTAELIATSNVTFTSSPNVSLGAVGNVHITGGSSGQVLFTDGAGNLSWGGVSAGSAITNGNSNVSIPVANGNINISAIGNANVVVVTGTGANITGTANITDDILAGANINVTANINGARFQNGNSNVAITANANITLTSNSNATMVITGTGANITGTANITNDILAGGNVNVSANVNGAKFQNGNSSVAITSNANITLTAKSNATMVISDTGANITGTANVSGDMSTGGNLTVSGTGVTSIAGNIDMNGKWVGNIGYAVANTDAASKLYVDTLISTGISYHAPVNAATTTTLATATGGTVAYNQPNGAGNGIGAFISTTGSFTTIDGVTINGSTSIRILVKDEANAAFNGVYTYTNATAITRSTDTNQSGTGNTERLGINDYFFTQAGTVNNGTSFIVSAPAGTITFGTSNIEFSIFSTSAVYTGGTGITVSGTVISANASQTQITAVGTLGSLDVSGNTTSGNFIGVFANGNSNVSIPAGNGNVNISAVGNANVVTVTGSNVILSNAVPLTLTGNNGTNLRTISLKSSTNANFSSNFSLSFPPNVGTSGQYLQTDGAGNMVWAGVSSGSIIANGTSNIVINNNANITMSSGGTSPIFTITPLNSRFNGDVYFANSIFANTSGGIVGNITNGLSSNIAMDYNQNGNMTFVVNANIMMTLTSTAVNINGNGNISAGNVNASVRINATGAGSTSDGGGQLYLNGGTLSRIDYNTAGTGAPSNTTRSAGTKLTLYPAVNSTDVDYAIGIAADTLWTSVPGAGQSFKWYAGITEVANLNGSGTFTASILRTAVDGSLVAVANNGSANRQVTIKASNDAGFTGNYTLTLPVNDGDNGQVLTTNGSGVLSWGAAGGSSSSISNGNSNVNIATANGNVNISAVGNTVLVVTGTGANITGTGNFSGNVSAANFLGVLANGNSNVSIPSANGNVNISAAGNANVLVVTGTSVVTTGQITSTQAGNLSDGGGQLYLNGSGNNRIDFNTNGTGAPTFTTRSAGTKIALYPSLSGSAGDYALGVDAGALWTSLPAADAGQFFKWYGGTTEVANLSGTGVFQVVGNANVGNLGTATAIITTGNITTINSGLLQNGNSNIAITANANITLTAASNATMVISDTGANITGTANVSSNLSAGNITTTAITASGNANFTGANVSLGAVANLKITGGTADYVLQTDGTGNLSWVAQSGGGGGGASIANGNSNVNIATANGNVTVSAVGNANILVVTGTGANVTGYANITGNANIGGIANIVGNIIGQEKLFVGLAGSSLTSPVAVLQGTGTDFTQLALYNSLGTGSADLVAYGNNGDDTQSFADIGFTGNNFSDANYTVTGSGDGYVFVQGNSSFGGNLVIATGNLGTTKDIIFATGGFQTGNIKARLYNANGEFSVTANIRANNFLGNLVGNLLGSFANGNSNVSIPAANGNVNISAVGTANVLVVTATGANVTGTANVTGNVIGGNIVTTGQITSTQAGNLSTGAGQLYLNGSGNNRIDFNINGTGAPTFTTRSAGQKITLYPALTGSEVDYAMGIAAGAFWQSIDQASSSFKWFAGTTEIANLAGNGLLTVGNIGITRTLDGVNGLTLSSGNTNIRFNVNNAINFQAIGSNVLQLTSTVIAPNANVIPASSNSFTLGNSSNYFANAFIDDLSSSFLDSENPLGFRNVPIVSVAANVANTVAADAGKAFYHASGAAVNTVNIAANANVSYINGTVLTFINLSANALTISCGDTMTFIANGATGSRTLANNGMATAIKVANTAWVITGSNIT
jgi:hypothetical protein